MLAYGDHPDQVIDVRLPAAGSPSRPLVIFVHGGFWRAAWDRTHTGPLTAGLAAKGWPVASIEYRRVGQPGGGWPGTFEDVEAAMSRLLDEHTGRPILAGHSAGGQLALWYAGQARDAVRGVLGLAPVCDLRAAYDEWLDNGAVHDLLGGAPDEVPERYAYAQPPAPSVPTILVHGTRDDRVPVSQSRSYVAGRDTARLVELPHADHFAVIDPESAAWPAVLAALDSLTPPWTR